jgi:hypothetical protein
MAPIISAAWSDYGRNRNPRMGPTSRATASVGGKLDRRMLRKRTQTVGRRTFTVSNTRAVGFEH